MRREFNNDSLVYSEGGIEEQENLLQDSTDMNQSTFFSRKIVQEPQTVRTQKFVPNSRPNVQLDEDGSLAKYLSNDSQIVRESCNLKSFRKLDKDKQRFLAFDPKLKNIALKPVSKPEKVNELVSLIESQRIMRREESLREFQLQLIELSDDLINQRKHLQREIENIIGMNKVMSSKLSEVGKFLEELKNERGHSCSCRRAFPFSKSKQSPIYYLDRFEFAKTIISSMEELELKRVEEEEGFSIAERPMIELLWALKNRVEDERQHLSQGIIDRVASGPTLRNWIKQIDQKLGSNPNVSEFESIENLKDSSNVMKQFLQVLKNEQEIFIQNIKQSKDPQRELEILKSSAMSTFLNILQDQWQLLSKNQVMAYLGDVNRCLTLVEKIGEVQCSSSAVGIQEITRYIEELY